MRTYTIALLGALAGLGGAACSDDSAHWEGHYQRAFEQQKGALETRVTSTVEQRERAACEGRLTELRQQLSPREASAAGSGSAEGGEGAAAAEYSYPNADQPMHTILQNVVQGRYHPLAEVSGDNPGWFAENTGSRMAFGYTKPCSSERQRASSPAHSADAGIESCRITLRFNYSRGDNKFYLANTRNIGEGEGEQQVGTEFEGNGQLVRWEDVTSVRRYDRSDGVELDPTAAAAQYRSIFTQALTRLQTDADRALAELMRPPTVE